MNAFFKTRLLYSLNCTFFKQSIDSFRDSMCVSLIPSTFQLSIVITCYSCFAFFASFLLLCAVLRHSHEEEEALGSLRNSVAEGEQAKLPKENEKRDPPMRSRSIGNRYSVNDFEMANSYT